MKLRISFLHALFITSLALSGCGAGSGPSSSSAPATPRLDEKAEAQANRAKLEPEDRMLAEEQGFCPVEQENALGSMGVPAKVLVKDQPVFLCCSLCRTKALAHADRTLVRVKELKSRNAGDPQK